MSMKKNCRNHTNIKTLTTIKEAVFSKNWASTA